MAEKWYTPLGGLPAESHGLAPGVTIHLFSDGGLKDAKGRNLSSEYPLLRKQLGMDVPDYVMKRIEHYQAENLSEKKKQRIKAAMEAAAAAEREAIQREERQAQREAQREENARLKAEFEAEQEFEEDDDDDLDLEDLEEALSGPTKTKKKKKKSARKKKKVTE